MTPKDILALDIRIRDRLVREGKISKADLEEAMRNLPEAKNKDGTDKWVPFNTKQPAG